ncbi:MAG: gliding motility-associated C-terminal domain-containing protein [Bacteroidales bacterium]|nr:gliding motility-associated C-terminal domain-containing protein [Bacteroidales bacterium]
MDIEMDFAMRLKNLIFVILVLLSATGYSQISSEAGFYKVEPNSSDSDSVFVFCTDDLNGGSLTVKDSTGNGGYDFAWYKFEDGTKDFTEVLAGFTVGDGDSTSTITGLSSGGYMVTLTNAVPAQTYVAWVYIGNELSVDLRFDDGNECDVLVIWADPSSHTTGIYFNTSFNYYDTVADEYINLKNRMNTYEWSNDNSGWGGFNTYNAPIISMFDLPTENTIFSIKATDRFGCFVENDISYTAIETRAKLLWEHMDERTEEVLGTGNNENEITGSAPLYAKFINDSENGQDYIWFLGDTLLNNDIDTIFTSDFYEEPEHIYYYVVDSGYTLKLISESSYGCKDSVTLKINVEPSSIEFPNVFTPNEDEFNKVFILTDYQSIRNFKITIFNRVGQVVHEYEGDVRDWEGWNGEIKNSNREAPEGNYFFIFEVKGWDNVEYNNNNFSSKSGTNSESTSEGTTGTEGTGSSTESITTGVIRLYR